MTRPETIMTPTTCRPSRMGATTFVSPRVAPALVEAITVRGLNRNGEKIKIEAEGWLARIFQHEIDHLDGVLYIDKLVSKDTLRRVEAGQEEADDLRAEAIG